MPAGERDSCFVPAQPRCQQWRSSGRGAVCVCRKGVSRQGQNVGWASLGVLGVRMARVRQGRGAWLGATFVSRLRGSGGGGSSQSQSKHRDKEGNVGKETGKEGRVRQSTQGCAGGRACDMKRQKIGVRVGLSGVERGGVGWPARSSDAGRSPAVAMQCGGSSAGAAQERHWVIVAWVAQLGCSQGRLLPAGRARLTSNAPPNPVNSC